MNPHSMTAKVMAREDAAPRMAKERLTIARLVWGVLIALTLVLFLAAIPARYNQLQTITPAGDNALVILSPNEAAALAEHGIPIRLYALYFILLETGFAAVYTFIGLVIFWRKSGQLLAMFASLTLVTFGVLIPATPRALGASQPGLDLIVRPVEVLGWSSFFTCFYIFPDGTFVPRWTRIFPLLFAVWGIAWILFPEANAFNWPLPLALLAFGAVFATGVAAQAYRYWRVSKPSEQQQTKWVVLGFAGSTAGILIFVLLSLVFPVVQTPSWERVIYHITGIAFFALSLLLIPISMEIAIRRSRLWAIDPIVNRAVVYSLLTLLLALVYAASIVVLQAVVQSLTGKQQPELVTVASTLMIAALFSPLRGRLQKAIDRRFYRQKYDAARTLAAFGATLRDEVDLDRLTDDLLAVVQETMAPEHVGLWLKKDKGKP